MMKQDEQIPSCEIFVDREGEWHYRGAPMVRKDIVRLFLEHLTLSSEGSYFIDLNGQRCVLDVEDTVFVVKRVEAGKDGDERSDGFFLLLNDGTGEFLSAETLEIGERDMLYCRVKQGRFKARFSRPAYYQIASHVEEDQVGFYIPVNGRRIPLLKGGS
jgi:hypothetical protein